MLTVEDSSLLEIFTRYENSGYLSIEEEEALKQGFGKPLGECTPCYWNNLKIFYRLKFRQKVMSNANPKYLISPAVGGSMRLFGEQVSIVNMGTEREGESIPLTDSLAEKLLKEAPDRAEYIIKNKEYKEPSAAQLRVAANQEAAKKTEAAPKTATRQRGPNKPKATEAPAPTPPAPPVDTEPTIDSETGTGPANVPRETIDPPTPPAPPVVE